MADHRPSSPEEPPPLDAVQEREYAIAGAAEAFLLLWAGQASAGWVFAAALTAFAQRRRRA